MVTLQAVFPHGFKFTIISIRPSRAVTYKSLSNEGLSVQTTVTDGIYSIFLCSLVDIPAAEHVKACVIFFWISNTKRVFSFEVQIS
jgi:hypothetical protein